MRAQSWRGKRRTVVLRFVAVVEKLAAEIVIAPKTSMRSYLSLER